MLRTIIIYACCTLFIGAIATPLYAASNQEKLAEMERKQVEAKAISSELKQEIAGLASEQRELKEKLVTLAKTLQQQETTLSEAKQKEAQASQELTEASKQLTSRRKELEAMIQAVVRLSQVRPEAMVMMPDMTEETMQTARTIRIMADTLRMRAAALRKQIADLQQLRSTLVALRKKSEVELVKVKQQRRQVAKHMQQRRKLTNKLNQQLGLETSRIETLAKQTKDLKQLMATIKKTNKKKAASPLRDVVAYVESAIYGGGKKGKMRRFTAMKGKLRAPSSGKIISRYNHKSTDEHSKGITIQTVSSASVSAPYDGKVAYAGKFRGYGNIVILKHTQDYFTLMAGLDHIHATEDEILLEGEPIGIMGDGNAQKLYVELRKGSDPINPSGWFEGL